MEQDEHHTILLPIQEELSEQHTRRVCCYNCTNEDIFLTVYIICMCILLIGGLGFILGWMIYKASA